jgi:hypothetical protein
VYINTPNFPHTDYPDDALLLTYCHTNLFLHEVALHDEHPPEDFRPPFKLDKIIAPVEDSAAAPQIDAITVCIASSQAMFDVLLNMDTETLRALPVFNYSRMTYAAAILTKLYISSRTPHSQIGPLFDRESLKLDFYLKSLILRLNEAAGPMEFRSPFTFLGLLLRLYSWFRKQESHDDFINPVELFGPDQTLSPSANEILFSMQNCDITPTYRLLTTPPKSKSLNNQDLLATPQSHQEQLDLNGVSDPQDIGRTSGNQIPPGSDFQFESLQVQKDIDPFLFMDNMDSFGDVDLQDWMTDMESSCFMNDGSIPEMY